MKGGRSRDGGSTAFLLVWILVGFAMTAVLLNSGIHPSIAVPVGGFSGIAVAALVAFRR